MIYIVRNGENISDCILNATGSLLNWQAVLDANGFTEWVPEIQVGQQIIIPDNAILKPDIKTALTKYPANNGSNIGDLEIKIMTFINLMTVVHYQDYFLPSRDELMAMFTNLKAFDLGGFGSNYFWSSTETGPTYANVIRFDDGSVYDGLKSQIWNIAPCRSFISSEALPIRTVGPAGGLIFDVVNNGDGSFTYYELVPDVTDSGKWDYSSQWSNINTSIGTTGTGVGIGLSNTNKIIAQSGFTAGAAKFCKDFKL